MPISNIQLPAELGSIQGNESVGRAAPGFADHLADFLSEANTEMGKAQEVTTAFSLGETNNLHETMLAAERAVIAFKLVGSIRNRLMDAYNEVMRMSL